MSGFVLHPDALTDLTEIWEYIAADNPGAAVKSRSLPRRKGPDVTRRRPIASKACHAAEAAFQ